MMTNQEILSVALAQSAADSNCGPSDFLSDKNKVVISARRDDARKYLVRTAQKERTSLKTLFQHERDFVPRNEFVAEIARNERRRTVQVARKRWNDCETPASRDGRSGVCRIQRSGVASGSKSLIREIK